MAHRTVRITTALLLAATLASCTSYRAAREAEIAMQQGNWDDAVLYYLEAVEQEPTNIAYRSSLLQAQVKASLDHFQKGQRFHEAGVVERALIEYQQAVQLDPSNQYAQVELAKVRDELAARAAALEPATLEELKRRTRGARPQPPVLNPRSDEAISLEFPEPTPIKSIYRALGKAFGINILFDPNLKDIDVPIVLRDVTAQDALEILMRAAGHFYKVLDEQTIMIAADTPQNRRNYEDLVIQAFFLSNADVKDAMTTLRSLIGAKQLAMNEQLNAIILRDTADKVKVAEKIIETVDKAKAEVVIDVELLQINTTKIRDLGVSLDTYSVTQSLDLGGDTPLRFSDLEFLNQSNWTLTIPNIIYNFVKTNTDAQLLAKPKLRISEGEQARLVIGDRVPIPVTSFNTANTVGGNIVPITSFQYQDVGIQIQIEPRVHHNKEVTLKLTVEVSQLAGRVGTGAQAQPIIGSRSIESTIRLKDGETNLLAGLIRSDDSDDVTGMPGLSDIPILGRLFSKNRTESRRTDVILTLTPHIVRLPDITEDDLLPIWVGTEANITFRGGSPRVESDVDGPFETTEPTSPEEIRRRIRERLQNLPRGLRDEGQAGDENEPPPGQELVPGLAPRGPFDNRDNRALPEPPSDDLDEDPPTVGFGGIDDDDDGRQVSRRTGAGEPGLDLLVEDLSDEVYALAARQEVTDQEAAAFSRYSPATSSPLANAAGVSLSLSARRPAAVGSTFEVVLDAHALSPISHLPVTLVFDPALLAVEKVTAGDFLGGAGAAEVLTDFSEPGRLVLGGSRLGRVPGVAGAGRVAVITFRALAEGDSEIAFDAAQALGPTLEPMTVAAEPLAVPIAPAGALPELERPERPRRIDPPKET